MCDAVSTRARAENNIYYTGPEPAKTRRKRTATIAPTTTKSACIGTTSSQCIHDDGGIVQAVGTLLACLSTLR